MVGISGQALKDGRYVMSGVNEKHKIKDKKQGIKTKREKKINRNRLISLTKSNKLL